MNRVCIKIQITINVVYLHDCYHCAVVVKLDSNYQEYIYRLNIYFHHITKTAYMMMMIIMVMIMIIMIMVMYGIVRGPSFAMVFMSVSLHVQSLQVLFMSFIYQ